MYVVFNTVGDDTPDQQNYIENQWQRYWADYGEQLILDSWKSKYSDYMDPGYSGTSVDNEISAEGVAEGVVEDVVEKRSNDNVISAKDDVASENVSASMIIHDAAISEPLIVNTELDNDVKVDDTWDTLWEQHRKDTYWYYHYWFEQWMTDSSQLNEANAGDSTESTDKKLSEVECISYCKINAAQNRNSGDEGLNLGEPQLLGAKADAVCCEFTSLRVGSEDEPADGKNGQKQRRRRTSRGKQGSYWYLVVAALGSVKSIFKNLLVETEVCPAQFYYAVG